MPTPTPNARARAATGGSAGGATRKPAELHELLNYRLIERIGTGEGKDRTRYRILVGGFWKPQLPVDNYATDPLI